MDTPAAVSLLIGDYAITGDCVTAALVGHNGNTDRPCWTHFDSRACLAALPGTGQGGRLRPARGR